MKYEKQERFSPLENAAATLKNKAVAIVGIGGLGSHSSEYLARVGVGTLILIDGDIVEETNLPRQGLYRYKDHKDSRFKVEAAKDALIEINPDINIIAHREMLKKENLLNFLSKADLVLDGSDNLATRYLINDFCFQREIPWIYASATSSVGVVSNFVPGNTPCFRCVYGQLDEDEVTCDANGIILPILTLVASYQTTEAIKILLEKEFRKGEFRYNIWTGQNSELDLTTLYDECCPCQTNKWHSSQKINLYLVCRGETTQANTNLTKRQIKDKLTASGYQMAGENETFVVLKKPHLEEKKIIAYKTGKVIFHQFNNEEILELLG
ncbi:HesA/MoeB/ThiF family protein [Bacillus mexicanus]|uniref:HesA/MoeB/ThiF family protein n=1 Tax=Bacillus mexicanus TaxID=2834415 RepID=UPI003D1EE0DD